MRPLLAAALLALASCTPAAGEKAPEPHPDLLLSFDGFARKHFPQEFQAYRRAVDEARRHEPALEKHARATGQVGGGETPVELLRAAVSAYQGAADRRVILDQLVRDKRAALGAQ